MPIAFSHGSIDRITEYQLRGFPLVTIGRFSYANEFAQIHYFIEMSSIRVGNFCSIAANVGFFQRENHHPDWLTTYPAEIFPFSADAVRPPNPEAARKADIEIGSDVWIGDGARILPGVTIGDGAVIGAGAVVTKDVPPYVLWAGNPGRVMRQRFAAADIAFLLEARWWNLPTSTLRRLAPVICSSDVDALRRAVASLGASERRPAVAARGIMTIRRAAWDPRRRRRKMRRSFAKRMAFVRTLFGARP